ncbi:putative integral membrane protein [Cryptosporidium hominis]|nr:putative integral membrane protein [Cryptosporidium hominis]PPA62776.1 putative integral membrane protein [Cryptosporidium hominis]
MYNGVIFPVAIDVNATFSYYTVDLLNIAIPLYLYSHGWELVKIRVMNFQYYLNHHLKYLLPGFVYWLLIFVIKNFDKFELSTQSNFSLPNEDWSWSVPYRFGLISIFIYHFLVAMVMYPIICLIKKCYNCYESCEYEYGIISNSDLITNVDKGFSENEISKSFVASQNVYINYGSQLGMSPSKIFSIFKPGFLSFFLLAYLTMLFFSPFVAISIPSSSSIMEFKRFMSSTSNSDSNLEKGILIQKHAIPFNNSDMVKLSNIGAYSIIKCVVSSIFVAYLFYFLHVSDSCIFKFFMFVSVIILTLSVGSFAFKEYLLETYVLLIIVSIIWSFICLHGNSFFKSEIPDLICSTLSVYLTMYTAGHFFSCIGMEVVKSPSYYFLFIPVVALVYYNVNSYYVTISPILYPFYHCHFSFQKSLIISWLSIIPIISLCLNLCVYVKNKTVIWFISSLPDDIIIYILSLTPIFENEWDELEQRYEYSKSGEVVERKSLEEDEDRGGGGGGGGGGEDK